MPISRFRRHARRETGFSYLILLFAVAVLGVAMAGVAQVWVSMSQRDREQELLFIGREFAVALKRFHEASPEAKRYPFSLEELLEDKRSPVLKRHLRKLYFDPMTRSQKWGLVRTGGQIVGIYSESQQEPFTRTLPEWVANMPDGAADAGAVPQVLATPAAIRDAGSASGSRGPGATRTSKVREWVFVPWSPARAGRPGQDASAGGAMQDTSRLPAQP